MEEIGVVKELDGMKAVIIVPKQGSCESCPGVSLCSTLGAEAQLEAYNHIDAKVGDTVKVVFKATTYLKGALLVYGLPAVMLVIGAIAGKEYLSFFFPAANPDLVSACGGFGLFAFSFLILKLWSKIFEHKKKEYMPIIEEIINRG